MDLTRDLNILSAKLLAIVSHIAQKCFVKYIQLDA